MGDPIEPDSPQCSTETPGKGRKDTYGVLRERDEEELPVFRHLKGLDAAFEDTPVPRRWEISLRRIPGSIPQRMMRGEEERVAGTQNPLQIPLF